MEPRLEPVAPIAHHLWHYGAACQGLAEGDYAIGLAGGWHTLVSVRAFPRLAPRAFLFAPVALPRAGLEIG